MENQQLYTLLLPWYQQHQRQLPWRVDREPYHVWLSEIMLQQTRVAAVIDYYQRFLQELPTLKALASVEEERLLKLWEGLGYYSRARNLQRTAKILVEQYHGEFPQTVDALLKLPGIGDYTAGAIASICFGKQAPAVDGNVLRVWSRLKEDERDITLMETKKQVREELQQCYPEEGVLCSQFTQSLMELGATICVPKGEPKCEQCPLQKLCLAYRAGSVQNFPVKRKLKQRRKEVKTVFLLCCGDKIAVRKRPTTGLLANLWELPNINGQLSEQEALDWLNQEEIVVEEILRKIEKQHIFTHIEWQMCCYQMRCCQESQQFYWATFAEVTEQLALPTAFRQFLSTDLF